MWGFFNQRGPNFADEFLRMYRDFDRMAGRLSDAHCSCRVFPPINIYDDGESYTIRAEIPGVRSADLDVQATSSTVSIKGERRRDPLDEKSSVERRERDYGVFNRTIELETEIEPNKISAKLENGVLQIVAPKSIQALPRQIKIN